MRGKAVFAVMVTLFMMTPVQAGEVSAFQSDDEDPRQPGANNTALYIYSDGMSNYWSHFADNDTDSVESYSDEKDNGVIDIKQRYLMTPTLDKRLSMEVGGEVRGNFNVYYEGDSDSTNNDGPCTPSNTPNDCDWLNITIFKGQTKIYQHTETPWPSGQWKNVQFSYFIEEGNETWDGRDANPLVEITMKVKGDESPGLIPGTVVGDAGAFEIKLGQEGSLLFPVDPASWEETFQEGGEIGEGPASEDTPGFTLVVASAAIAMAAFINQRRPEVEE